MNPELVLGINLLMFLVCLCFCKEDNPVPIFIWGLINILGFGLGAIYLGVTQ